MATLPLPGVGESYVDYYIALLLGASDDWLKREDNWLEADYETALQHIERLKAWLAEVTSVAQLFPLAWNAPCAVFEWSINTGALNIATAALPHGSTAFQQAATLGDFCQTSVFLDEGTYTLDYWYATGGDVAIVNILLDGEIVIGSLDQYAAQGVAKASAALTVSESGNHILKIVSTGKRAASIGYRIRGGSVVIWKTLAGGGG